MCTLIAAVRTRGRPIFMDPDDSPSLLPTDPNSSAPTNDLTELQLAARNLMAEIRVWDEAENFTPLHPRTQYGNLAYRHAIKIRMLRKVYDVPSDDERVASSAESIIELAAEMLAFYGKITWLVVVVIFIFFVRYFFLTKGDRLTWPIVIAGFEIPRGHPSRQTALEMLGAFG